MAINLNHTSDSLSPDSGTANVTGDLAVTGVLKSNNSSGDEGGQLDLANAKTNTNIVTGVSIDVYQNKVRIFETGGTNRGYYFDMNTAAAGVGTQVGTSGGGSNTDTLAIITARGNTTSNVILITSNLQATGANTGAFRVEGGISSNANIFASGNIYSTAGISTNANIFASGNIYATAGIVTAGNIILPAVGNIITATSLTVPTGNITITAGNVGIGTNPTGARLQVTVTGDRDIARFSSNAAANLVIYSSGNIVALSDILRNQQILFVPGQTSSGSLLFAAGGSTKLTIKADTGYVGVGSGLGLSPTQPLSVEGNILTTGNVVANSIITTGNIRLPAVGNIIGTTTSFIIPSGNVGIGTTSPTATLHVVGNIHSTTGITTTGNIVVSGNILGNIASSTYLPNSGVTATTYGSATVVPVITVDQKGRITSASNVTISASGSGAPANLTDIGGIVAGLYVSGAHPATNSIPVNIGDTVAGSTLRYNFTGNNNGYGAGLGKNDYEDSSQNATSTYSGGGTTPSGTWRCIARPSYGYLSTTCGTTYYWYPGLWQRIS